MTKEEKKSIAAKRKELREKLKSKYGVAIMDGKEVEVGNYMAEPPGIFIGRGEASNQRKMETSSYCKRCYTKPWKGS